MFFYFLRKTIIKKIDSLEKDLGNNACNLRKAVDSFVRTIAGTRKDELSGTGVELRNTSNSKEVLVHLENGEAAKEEANGKIERIIRECINTASEDVLFLKDISEKLQQNSALSQEEVSRLKGIIKENSYWRFIDVV